MTEFRKWWENHRASVGPHTCQSSRGENLAQLADEEIWRAALKEVLKQNKRINRGSIGIIDWIDKELWGDT